jgi:hypothetical protein
MLLKAKKFYKKFFHYFGHTELKIIGNSGLILLKDYIIEIGLVDSFNKVIKDNRDQMRIIYRAPEILLSCILRILNGEFRLSHCHKTNKNIFEEMYACKTIPDWRTLIYYFKQNPQTSIYLEKILFEMAINQIKNLLIKNKLKRITLDIDQTARAINGYQEGAKKGYSAKDKNSRLFQTVTWSIRETKTIVKQEFLSGEKHSANDFLERLKPMIIKLKKIGVNIRVVCDSGYADIDVFEYLESEGVEFIFAIKQHNTVKKRGKYAKNKELQKQKRDIIRVFKERFLETTGGHIFREIFVQNRVSCDEYGQMYLKNFHTNEFTNVFVTNMQLKKKNIYNQYKDHAVIETIIEELKNDFKIAISHNQSFTFNSAMSQLVAIAYNVKNMFISEKKIFQREKEIIKLSTLQRNFIHIPGIIVNNGGRTILKLEKYYFDRFKNYFKLFGYKIATPT